MHDKVIWYKESFQGYCILCADETGCMMFILYYIQICPESICPKTF